MAEAMTKKRDNDEESTEEVVATEPGQNPQVLAWRKEEFLKLGYSLKWAEFLSDCSLELHGVRKMLGQGCDRQHAVEILAGTEPTGGEDAMFDWVGYEKLRLAL